MGCLFTLWHHYITLYLLEILEHLLMIHYQMNKNLLKKKQYHKGKKYFYRVVELRS